MTNIYTWEEIIQSDRESISLIGYGSLLNPETHHNSHSYTPVVAFGVKRLFNLQAYPETMTQKEKDFFFKYLNKSYGSISRDAFNNLIGSNITVLNCILGNGDDKINGLLMTIAKKDFLDYSIRECQYNLIEVDYNNFFDPKTGGKAFLLSAHETIENGQKFEAYYKKTREGAYMISEEFGKLFDETTQLN